MPGANGTFFCKFANILQGEWRILEKISGRVKKMRYTYAPELRRIARCKRVLRFVGNEEQSVWSGRWTDTKSGPLRAGFPGRLASFLGGTIGEEREGG